MIQAIPNVPCQLVEIGIGLGDLTQELAKRDSLVAYEVDADLCSLFCKNFPQLVESGRVELINKNVLELESRDKSVVPRFYPQTHKSVLTRNLHSKNKKSTASNMGSWLWDKPYMLISNLPYYIATHIVTRALRDHMCKYILVMTQKEVAQKFCAQSMQSNFCALSVLTQVFGKADILFDVPNTAFEPVPKVTSSVFFIDKYLPYPDFRISEFEMFLKSAFRAPRKKLGKNLDMFETQKIFSQLQIPSDARPHEVNTQQYLEIYKNKELKNARQQQKPTIS
ncbi:MAG: 16S rRNA (adenine(1518)-N(6)/adenine(1519)-N(6))-dimethyltransferase [Helicobacter sp.]|nr:16S rRNA (adenine(1518)-N(6)/adenine(1519)-N(6))-dimethyltransferase [Helicobacter sp.]